MSLSNTDNQARRPFELVRYFTVTSLVVLLLFTLLISSLVGMRTSELVLHKKEQYALLLAENLNHQVMVRFVLPITRTYGSISVGQAQQAALLDSVVKNTIHSFQVKRVNILDLQGNIIYSTEPEYVGRVTKQTEAFMKAAAGQSVSFLDPPQGVFDFGANEKRVFKTLSPMRDERIISSELGEPKAVFEITLDINEDFEEVWLNQLMLVSALLLLMAFLFIILRSIVNRGYLIMDSRAMELRDLEDQLNQSERLATLGRMVAGVAHEIKNPLGIVRSTAELLQKRSQGNSEELAQVIVEESTRLNQVVNEFLDFARPQKANLKETKVGDVLARLQNFMQGELERNEIELEIVETTNRPTMLDVEQMYRALLNIVSNAMQALEGSNDKYIKITTRLQREKGRDWLQIVCDDNGPGFPPEYTRRMFEPFYTTKDNGTGLGLSIVKTIVEAHDGRIELRQNDCGGAQVVISLRPAK